MLTLTPKTCWCSWLEQVPCTSLQAPTGWDTCPASVALLVYSSTRLRGPQMRFKGLSVSISIKFNLNWSVDQYNNVQKL